jgi:hypothetical protein
VNHLMRRVKKLELSAQPRKAHGWIPADFAEVERRTWARLSEEDRRLVKEYERALDNESAKNLSKAHQEAWRRFQGFSRQVSVELEWGIHLSLDECFV